MRAPVQRSGRDRLSSKRLLVCFGIRPNARLAEVGDPVGGVGAETAGDANTAVAEIEQVLGKEPPSCPITPAINAAGINASAIVRSPVRAAYGTAGVFLGIVRGEALPSALSSSQWRTRFV